MVCSETPLAGKVNCVGEYTTIHKFIVLIHEWRTGASTVLSVVYDLPTASSPDDPTVTRVNAFTERISHYAIPGNYLVEFFTWMKYIPSSIAKWKKGAEEGYKDYSRTFLGLFHDVENRIVMSFIRSSSFPDSLLGDRNKAMNDRVLLGL